MVLRDRPLVQPTVRVPSVGSSLLFVSCSYVTLFTSAYITQLNQEHAIIHQYFTLLWSFSEHPCLLVFLFNKTDFKRKSACDITRLNLECTIINQYFTLLWSFFEHHRLLFCLSSTRTDFKRNRKNSQGYMDLRTGEAVEKILKGTSKMLIKLSRLHEMHPTMPWPHNLAIVVQSRGKLMVRFSVSMDESVEELAALDTIDGGKLLISGKL